MPNKATTLQQYNKEIQPSLHSLFKKQDILKEFVKDDGHVASLKEKIKEINDEIKEYIADKEPDLVREIEELTIDVNEAIKAAAKNSDYKAAELKGYFVARAKQKIEDAIDKAELFTKLNDELV